MYVPLHLIDEIVEKLDEATAKDVRGRWLSLSLSLSLRFPFTLLTPRSPVPSHTERVKNPSWRRFACTWTDPMRTSQVTT